MQKQGKGFTLVELSIVLVIIGLIAGGILTAQSIIHTANIQKFIRQIQQFDAAIANFQTKYNGLPGDASAMGCIPSTTNGPMPNTCNNGLIEDDGDGSLGYGFPRYYGGELVNFWPNLQQSGMTAPGGATYSTNIDANGFTVKGASPISPLMALGTNTGIIAAGIANDPNMQGVNFPFAGTGHNYYMMANFTESANNPYEQDIFSWQGNSPKESIPAADALAVDTKIDNGLPDTGANTDSNVIDATAVVDNVGFIVIPPAPDTCSNGNTYNFSDSGKCVLLIKMLSTNGMGN